jgi:threonine dehydrogenase-like Zn-dependent dehydrogenase
MRALVVTGEWEPRAGFAPSDEELRGRWARDARQVWRNPSWAVTEVPDPRLREPTDVIVRVRAAGLAVSTLRMTATDEDGYVMLPYRMGLPLVPGHEFAGEVVEAGPAVDGIRVGDAVAVETLRTCGRCAACRRGRVNACLDGRFAGFNIDGGLAEYAVVPAVAARSLEPLRERFDEPSVYEIGALCEPAAVSYLALFDVDRHLRPGMSVAVHGCGPLGLAAVALVRCAGAALVLAVDPVPERADLAARLGADRIWSGQDVSPDTLAASILAQTSGRGTDLVVDASGNAAEVLPVAQRTLATGGHVVHLGVGGPAATFRPMDAMVRAGTHSFSMGHLGGFDPVIALHAAGRIDLTPIIGARSALEDGLTALVQAGDRQTAKVLVLPTR